MPCCPPEFRSIRSPNLRRIVPFLVAAFLPFAVGCSGESPVSTVSSTTEATTTSTTVSSVLIPPWAEALDTPEEYLSFLAAVETDLNGRGIEYELDISTGAVLLPDDVSLGLENLAQRVAAQDDEDSRDTIAEHFNTVIALVNDPLGEGTLRLRVYPETYEIDFSCTQIGDIYLVPVFDFPDSIRSITRDELTDRDVDPDAYCEAALDDTLTYLDEVLEVTEHQIEGIPFFALEYPFYASTAALDPSRFVELPADGAVVFLPVSHAALVLPLTGPEVTPALADLSSVTDAWYADGPNSLSLSPFWWSSDTGLVPLPDPRFDALFESS